MRVSAIVLAAGKGLRFKSRISKPLVKLAGKPILVYSLQVLSRHPDISDVIIVAGREDLPEIAAIVRKYRIRRVRAIVLGGPRRQDSVACGLAQLNNKAGLVLVHDSARPFIDQKMVSRVIRAAKLTGAAIAGVAVKSTIKKVKSNLLVDKTIPRDKLWEIQTPQVFRRELILKAYRRHNQVDATDDAMLAERAGVKVKIVEGSNRNIKITTPDDLALAAAIAAAGK